MKPSMRVAVVGPAGPTTSSRTRSTGADVVDNAIGEVDRQLLALSEHVGDALVGGVAAGEHLAVEQQRPGFTTRPARWWGVEVDAVATSVSACQVTAGQSSRRGAWRWAGPEPSEFEVDNDGWQRSWGSSRPAARRRGSGGRDLDVEDGGEATQALRRRCLAR